jgi:uncharacterized membrane protein
MAWLAPYHPTIVPFAIALLPAGLVFRWLFLSGRAPFADHAARILLLAGILAAALAVHSGLAAHGPVERVPGSREAVDTHEGWGKRTLVVFLVVGGLEIVALGAARWGRSRPVLLASGVVGLLGLVCLFEAGEHGEELVYSYAGGVGIRDGNADDVGRLLLAGLYHQAQLHRKEGRREEAATLIDTAVHRFPGNLELQIVAAESRLVDRRDPAAALRALEEIHVPGADRRLRVRHALLTADALVAAGQPEGARALLLTLQAQLPDDARLKKKLEEVQAAARPLPTAAPTQPPTEPSPPR